MNDQLPYRVGFVGLGLIGGSFALALRQGGKTADICAWDRDPQALEEGQELGVIDRGCASLAELMSNVDVAVLAAPTMASATLLPEMLALAAAGTLVTDVASVKGALCDAVADLPDEKTAHFVPGHPIAGSERHGVAAARADLFRAHRVILTPLEHTDVDAVTAVTQLWESAGASVQTMSVSEHDAILAATSHLPHVLAYALVDALAASPTRDDIFRFAAGGFRDFTRIASSDPVMWRDIALANREPLLAAIDEFSEHLDALRRAIDDGDGAALDKTFGSAKAARDEFARDLERRSLNSDTGTGPVGH